MRVEREMAEAIELRFAVWGVGGETQMSDAWMDEVEKRTRGRVHFERHYYTAGYGQKIEASAFNDVLAIGGEYPLLDLIQTPYIIPNSSVGSRVVAQLYAEFRELRDELKGVKTLGLGTGALMAIISSKAWGPIRRLENLKGARIRSLQAIDADMELLGAIPLHPTTFEEISRMLEVGELDAAVIGIGLVKSRQLVKQAPYCNVGQGASISMHPMRIYMPWDAWNKLPRDIQEILEEMGPAGGNCWFAAMTGTVFDRTIPDSSEYILKNGGQMVTIPASELNRWMKVLQPLREQKVNALEAVGLPGKKFFKRILELIEQYRVI
jgi:TRAP-type transport system periplasmic protein